MKMPKFKLYQHKPNRYLKRMINTAGRIDNHCVALHKRYYRRWGKHLNCARLQKHITKLRKQNPKRNPWWLQVGSQAVQDICQRIEKAYQLFFKQSLNAVRKANRQLSHKQKGSANRERARLHLARQHEDIAHRRRDWFWKLAHQLTNQFDVLCFDRGFPSSKTCSSCGHGLEHLDLEPRHWRCPVCSAQNERDENAAFNLKMAGASVIGLGDVRRALPAIAV